MLISFLGDKPRPNTAQSHLGDLFSLALALALAGTDTDTEAYHVAPVRQPHSFHAMSLPIRRLLRSTSGPREQGPPHVVEVAVAEHVGLQCVGAS
jgi:hypothetical protein